MRSAIRGGKAKGLRHGRRCVVPEPRGEGSPRSPDVSAGLLAEIDAFLDHLKSASGAVARAAKLRMPMECRLTATRRKSL